LISLAALVGLGYALRRPFALPSNS
jgi:hypothetical protein